MTQDQIQSIAGFVIPLLLFFVVIYFFIMRPEKKRQRAAYEMISAIQKNDRIVTIGGIHGIIEDINENVVTITLVSGAKMKVEKTAIKRVITE